MKAFLSSFRATMLCLGVFVFVSFPLMGCGKARRERAEEPTPGKAATEAATKPKPDVRVGDADILAPLTATQGQSSEADRAWEDVMRAVQPPTPPPEWETNPPTKEAIAEFEKKNSEMAAKVADKARDFYLKFPQHDKVEEARQAESSLLGIAAQMGNTNAMVRLQVLEEARLKDPNLPEDDRVQLRVEQIERASAPLRETNMSAALDLMEKGARSLQKDFPKRADVAGLLLSVAQARVEAGEADKGRALAKEILDTKPEGELKDTADALIRKLDRVGKTLTLKFKAVDGREVDVQQMKGKVVLIDFWATWCGPCMQELPRVKTTFEKLHRKGFEIVGISFDRNRETLEKVTSKEKMTWPQFFDESGQGNRFGDEFNIEGIPTMWLVDKKGLLRELNARENLAEKVEKLLAE